MECSKLKGDAKKACLKKLADGLARNRALKLSAARAADPNIYKKNKVKEELTKVKNTVVSGLASIKAAIKKKREERKIQKRKRAGKKRMGIR
tara:strand:+ start:386 stop:661 length:276 start_codon:yes stop_codon:yes gene_type:complete